MSAPARRIALFDPDHALLPLDSIGQWADVMARTGRAGCQARGWRVVDPFAGHTAPPTLSPA